TAWGAIEPKSSSIGGHDDPREQRRNGILQDVDPGEIEREVDVIRQIRAESLPPFDRPEHHRQESTAAESHEILDRHRAHVRASRAKSAAGMPIRKAWTTMLQTTHE